MLYDPSSSTSSLSSSSGPGSKAGSSMKSEDLFKEILAGKFQNIVVLTGAGISTSAGIPDFRSAGGLFEGMIDELGDQFPQIKTQPEILLSRSFVRNYPEIFHEQVYPRMLEKFDEPEPTLAHRFCVDLHERGWLKRVYTQNIDGLHTLAGLPSQVVVDCHGSVHDLDELVLYEDPLPDRFFEKTKQDFSDDSVDLIIVLGTSLQVAPFCWLPNLAPSGATRVLVNRNLEDCCAGPGVYGIYEHVDFAGRTNVCTGSLWQDRRGDDQWRQLLVESDCDDFAREYFELSNEKLT